MVKKSSSHASSPSVSPTKENPIEEKSLGREDETKDSKDTTNNASPPSPGSIRRSWEVATQLCSSNAASLRERHPQIAAGVDTVSNRTKEALQQLVPESFSPSKFGAKVDSFVGDLRIKSATKKSWEVSTELLEKEVEPVVKHLELSVESLGSNIYRLAASFFSIVGTLFKVTSQVADSFWQPPRPQTVSPCSSSTQCERSWSSVGSSLQDIPVWRRSIGYIIQIAILFMAMVLTFVRIIVYRFLCFIVDFQSSSAFWFDRLKTNLKTNLITNLKTKVKAITNDWFLFVSELFAFVHFMFGCFAVYVFELLKFYQGPGSSFIRYLPKLLPKSLQAYIVENTDGEDTSMEGDYNAEFASREPGEGSRPNFTT